MSSSESNGSDKNLTREIGNIGKEIQELGKSMIEGERAVSVLAGCAIHKGNFSKGLVLFGQMVERCANQNTSLEQFSSCLERRLDEEIRGTTE